MSVLHSSSLGAMRRHQQRLAFVVQQLGVGQPARCEDVHRLALHRPSVCGHITHLLANRDLLAKFDRPRQMVVERVKQDTGHHHRHDTRQGAFG